MPIMRPAPVGQSTEPPVHTVAPIPDHETGHVFPYRGVESHGVEPGEDYTGHELTNDVPDEWNAPKHTVPVEPVPVRIVSQGSREYRTFTVARSYATGISARIAGKDDARTTLRIRNLGTVTVWVSPDSSVQPFMGYPVPANTEWTTTSIEDVWAVSDDTTQQALAVMTERSIREP